MEINLTIPTHLEAGLKFAAWKHNQNARASFLSGEGQDYVDITPEEYLLEIINGALNSYESTRAAHVKAEGLKKYDESTPEYQAQLKAALGVSEPWLS